MRLKFPYSASTIARFLEELGSNSSYPGGGSGAALTAATGSALVEMVSRINTKKDAPTIKKIRLKLQNLMTDDAKAFQKISKFFKIKIKGPAYQKALRHGASVPLEICELSNEALALGCLEIGRTSRWLASDLAESGILLAAAFHSARLNVEINLQAIHDQDFVNKTRARLNRIAAEIEKNKKRCHKF